MPLQSRIVFQLCYLAQLNLTSDFHRDQMTNLQSLPPGGLAVLDSDACTVTNLTVGQWLVSEERGGGDGREEGNFWSVQGIRAGVTARWEMGEGGGNCWATWGPNGHIHTYTLFGSGSGPCFSRLHPHSSLGHRACICSGPSTTP